ncbi:MULTISPECIES: EAL domain-containing protein [Desulfitobacterium]|uniref:PAS domain S-box/diguanylate cyclase (GGDEF) domain-containing protein n=1 Tax=Desulfitobacterium dehalogenans (strain ATCC 51507 / DSM 9161 / JW/IU-DC1) TaxID=756499 RepID=I4A8F6_DESDJ|nr:MULTISPECIES: EAL domain-containing protein [Desulfitobacterium]AFM00241.1 PAS domain S-box/diguanylate cyclase (GGDEF) domain-containing protein [Desulfitobacterium dehalogenans ATCC 51507]
MYNSLLTQRRWAKAILLILFLLGGSIMPKLGYATQDPVHILILNSYHQGLEWTYDQTEGILRKLQSPGEQQIYVEYLDWKRYPTLENLNNQFDYLQAKYIDQRLDLIITTDDAALKFALDHREEIFSGAPIVFSGILEKSAEELLQGHDRVTGAYEIVDSEGTIKLAMGINPQIKNIYVLYDLLESGLACGEDVFAAVQRINRSGDVGLVAHSLAYLSLSDILQKVATLDKDSIVLLGSYNMDSTGLILSTEGVANQVSQSSSVPVYSLYEFLLDSGVTGGSLLSGEVHGEYAGEQALKVLAGQDVNTIPIIKDQTFVTGFNYNELERFHIPENLIPQGSMIINKPFSFVDTYRSLVYNTVTVLLLLLLLVAGLLINIRRRMKVENNLRIKNEEIAAMHEELTATEEELRQQFDELLNHQQQLKETQQLQELVLEAATDTIWDWDMLRDIRIYHSKTSHVLGYRGEEVGSVEYWNTLMHPDDKAEFEAKLNEHLTQKTPRYSCDYRIKDKEGVYKWIRAFGKALYDQDGNPYRMLGSHRDITDIKEKEMHIEYLAYHDFLTGLPNRAQIQEIIKNEIPKAGEQGTILAVLFLDIDNFKAINDSFGHPTGDQLLITISRHLTQILDNHVVARLAGDEFLILIRDIKEREEALNYAQKIMKLFEKALVIYKQYCYVSASIGITFYPQDGESYESLLINADTAMHKAKELGKRNYVVFNIEMKKAVMEKAEIQNNLRKAIEFNEFVLHYQPQVEPHTGRVLGLEALIRWEKDNKLVPPNKFIGIAEETGLIVPIGDWVITTACAFLKKLHDLGYQELTMSVNISALQLQEDQFVDKVLKVLRDNNLDSGKLELEITETVLIEFLDAKISHVLDSLIENNIKISLDDFGLGYSSLNYIKQLPISTLKVDKSFIDDIQSAPESKNITGLIVTMAHQLGLKVVAEGVEKPEQREYLIKYDCDAIQGYLASKPLPEEEIIKVLNKNLL